MTPGRRGSLAVALVLLVAVGGAGATRVARTADPGRVERARPDPPDPVERDARRFLDAYVEPDGRVVRHDQGGDTVSEGQAYAMLVAVGVGDRSTFELVWSWTTTHLRRPDGLLAWRWAEGAVADAEPAADADLDAAWALALAARRWPGGGHGAEARALAAAVASLETAPAGAGATVLAAGPWALRSPSGVVVNPSYSSPVAEHVLAEDHLIDPAAAAARAAGGRQVTQRLLDDRTAPTDWALVSPDGAVTAVDRPGGAGPGRFGWDAVRVPLRLAASCDPADRALAARVWPAMEAGAGVELMGDHPARLVGAAAAVAAAGGLDRAGALLDEASAGQRSAPTYYGGALVALGRLLLTTDRVGGCPLLAGG